MLLIPLIQDLHFYLVYRLLHWPPLYKMVHSLHHNNVNPGPGPACRCTRSSIWLTSPASWCM
ncbi:sterol desaturase family protein [Mesorhizobium sp. M0715]